MTRTVRLLVCGGRTFRDEPMLRGILDRFAAKLTGEGRSIGVLMTGAQTGADVMAESWAAEQLVDVESYPADWDSFGNAAGPVRNARMLREGKPTHAICFPGGRGTSDMTRRCLMAGVETYAVDVDGKPRRLGEGDVKNRVGSRRMKWRAT